MCDIKRPPESGWISGGYSQCALEKYCRKVGNILEKNCIIEILRFRSIKDVDELGLLNELLPQFVVG